MLEAEGADYRGQYPVGYFTTSITSFQLGFMVYGGNNIQCRFMIKNAYWRGNTSLHYLPPNSAKNGSEKESV